MQTHDKDYSFVIFPFLKTRSHVTIGDLAFRATDDTIGLSTEQAACVSEIASMLFLQDNLRIKSASYAVVPFIDLSHATADVQHFVNVQAFVAYCYASPRHEFGDLFLSSEHVSMAIFTPGQVSVYVVRPDFHVNPVAPTPDLGPDNRGYVQGYAGLYNFRHYFWAAKGSRLYGPKPHLTLNQSQDLSFDLARATETRVDYRLLSELLRKPETQISSRVFRAVRWFNAANNEANDEAAAIVNLSIAFEALLSLPIDQKTDRLIDAVSLLLGRIPRLDIWARQFYHARSRIVHEGHTQQLRFVATDSQKGIEGPLYQSLLSYGRQVFQFCLGTLLTGAELSQNAGLEEKLITNQERFQKICRVLADTTIGARERLESIAPIVAAMEQYRFVPESGLQLETMIDATRLAAKTLLEHGEAISQELKEHLECFATAMRTNDHLQELDALRALHGIFANKSLPTEMGCGIAVRDLVDVVWNYVFMHYFWLKERLLDKSESTSNQQGQTK